MECCLIPISKQPFPWEVQSRISGLIRGNLQMFVNMHAATESGEDLPFKRSDVESLSEVGFLGNHDHWARSLSVYGARPLACRCESSFSLHTPVFLRHRGCTPHHNELTVNQWMLFVCYNLQRATFLTSKARYGQPLAFYQVEGSGR